MAEQGSIEEGTAACKKRRHHTTRACVNCRRRKAKCDGAQPICGTCGVYKDDCQWADDSDGRKPASRRYVQSLKQRIRTLETLLKSEGQALPPETADGNTDELAEDDGDDSSGTEHQASLFMSHLQLGTPDGQIHFHGPTSAYAHISPDLLQTSSSEGDRSIASTMVGDLGPHDHRRFLPRDVQLSASEHANVLDRFFRFFASWGLRVVPTLFHADMLRAIRATGTVRMSRASHYSPFLHNVILAVALGFADNETLRSLSIRTVFMREADRYFETEIARPSLATVHALALKPSFYSLQGDHMTGWTSYGLADRAAQSLGLNVDCSDLVRAGRMSDYEMLARNNTFWTVYIQDQCWSVYIGRPHPIVEHDTPLPAVDASLDHLQWSGDCGKQNSMLSTCFVETAKLVIIMQQVMISMYSPRANVAQLARSGKISELSLALDSWLEQLPPSLCISAHPARTALPHVIMLHLAWEWLVILLYRPIYRPIVRLGKSVAQADISAYAVKRCDRSSARIVTLLKLYHSLYDVRFVPPTLLNVAFIAGTTHLLAAAHHRSVKLRQDALRGANECIRHLRLTGVSWRAASDKADVLQSLLDEYQPLDHQVTLSLGPRGDPARSAEHHQTAVAHPPPLDPSDQASIDYSWLDACLADPEMTQWQPPVASTAAPSIQAMPGQPLSHAHGLMDLFGSTVLQNQQVGSSFPAQPPAPVVPSSNSLSDGFVRAILEHTSAAELVAPNLFSNWATAIPSVQGTSAGDTSLWGGAPYQDGRRLTEQDYLRAWNITQPIPIPSAGQSAQEGDSEWASFFGASSG